MSTWSWKDSEFTLKDGIKLASRIWYPSRGGPWPALLMRQPYGKSIASTVTYAHPSWWAKHGYLVIVQDVRGQGDSEGQFEGFKQEAHDTKETHEWVRSLPECNGKLGTYGFSYQGLTQLLAEEGAHPPDCIAPAMTGLDEESHWSCEGGAYWWHIGISWGIQLATLKARRDNNWEAWEILKTSLENKSYLRNGHLLLQKYDPNGMAFKWFSKSNKKDPQWIKYTPLKAWLRKPILLIGGWWDPHLRGILDIYEQSINAGGSPEIHIGPATHLQWWDQAQLIQLDFFNRNLLSKEKKEPAVKKINLWNITREKWISEKTDWKKDINYRNTSWSLLGSGTACANLMDGKLDKNSKGSGQEILVHDPWRPVQAVGGHLGEKNGKVNRIEIDKRFDVANFTSPKLTETVELKGIPSLELGICSEQESFDICVALSVINKEQTKAIQLSTGFLRVQDEKSQQNTLRKIILQPVFASIGPEEKLRLSLSGSCWPAIGINPGHKNSICGPPKADCLVITLKIDLSTSKLQFFPLIST